MIKSINTSRHDIDDELDTVSVDQILWSGNFLDGKLFFVKTSTPLHIHWHLESLDCYASGCIDMPREITLQEVIADTIDQIKSIYTALVLQKKNEDFNHGAISIH